MLRERNKDFFASKFVHWTLHIFLNWVGNLEALEKAFDKSHVTASLSRVHQQTKDATIGCLAIRLLGKLMTLRCLGTGKIVPIIPQVSPKILSSCRPSKRARYNCHISLDPQTTAHQSKAVTHLSALFIFLLLKTKYQLGKQVVLTRCSNTYHPTQITTIYHERDWRSDESPHVDQGPPQTTLVRIPGWCCGFLISRTVPKTQNDRSLTEMTYGPTKTMPNWMWGQKRSY